MIETKANITQSVLDAIGKSGNKSSFIPDRSLMDAIRFIEEKGFPNSKNEEYKYCNIESVLRKEFKNIINEFNSVKSVAAYTLKDCYKIVVLNGAFCDDLSDKTNDYSLVSLENTVGTATKIGTIADVNTDALIAVNTAFSNNGFYLRINGVLKKPIQIINISSVKGNSFVNPRQLVVLEKNAEAKIIETFVSYNNTGKIFTNQVAEVFLEENVKLDSYRIQMEDSNSFLVNTTQALVNQNANFTTHTFTFGGAMVRNNLNVVLGSEYCEAHLNGLFVAKNTQLIDNHTLVDHTKPNCPSNELYKGVAKDKGTGIFNGKIYVRKDAQKTNAYQSSKNILLSDDATINTKPQLEIYANFQ